MNSSPSRMQRKTPKTSPEEEEDKEAVGTVEKQKNWSSVNLAFQALRVRVGALGT